MDALYFRMNDQNIYYTETKDDQIVLGAIQLNNLVSTTDYF